MARCCGNFCREFRAFALRGSVIDLAIGIVLGTAIVNVVQSFVDDIITPPLGLVLGGVDFVNLTIQMKNFVYKNRPPVVVRYGKFIQTIISLIIIVLALFFIIKAINKLHQLTSKKAAERQTMIPLDAPDQVQVLCDIRDLLAKQTAAK